MYLSIEQILKEEMLTLGLREDTVGWISREFKQGLAFIVHKNSYSRLVGYAICDCQHCHFKHKGKATLTMEAADSSKMLVNLYLTVKWHLRRQFLQVNSSHNKCLSLKIITLRLHCMMLQSELTAVKADRYRLEGELVILRQANVEEKLRAIDQHSQEYIQWHDKAVARVRQEANEQIQALTADFK
jgi:hypothetical protein